VVKRQAAPNGAPRRRPPERRRRIILDCDPGHDDAIAILLAAHSPRLKLEAITTVAGNQTVEKTSQNALKVCSLAGIRDVPVAAGMDRPLVQEQHLAPEIHGETGLDGPLLPEPTLQLAPVHAVDLIIDRLLQSNGDLTIVATGPLTNIATAMRREPRILPKIERVVLMGGAIGIGNWTPAAEFNIYVDPEAAAIVFNSGCPLTMVGLEVTHQAQATLEVRQRLATLGSPTARLVEELLDFFAKTYLTVFGLPSPPVHDPCAVAHVIDATLLQTRPMRVDVELRGEFTRGSTVCDLYGITGRPANAEVGVAIDAHRFWDLVIETLSTY
jgi:inosine-uridine nucleoside N-ribohydrolase